MQALSPKSYKYSLVFDGIFSDITINSNKVQLPDLSLDFDDLDYGTFNVKYPGNRLNLGDLTISVFIDKYYENYCMLQDWLKLLANYKDNTYTLLQTSATLNIYDSSTEHNLRAKVYLKGVCPRQLSSIQLSTSEDEDPFELVDVTFKVDEFEMVSEKSSDFLEKLKQHVKDTGNEHVF